MNDWNPSQLRMNVNHELTDIATLYRDLPDEAANHADDKMFPGGDALNMAGPAANLEAWEHRHEAAEDRGDPSYAHLQADTELHPLLVLASWEDILRDHRNQPTDLRASVTRAADYISKSLDWALTENDYTGINFPPIEAMLTDLRKVRRRMEELLRDGEQVDKGAPCLGDECGGVLLVKNWADDEKRDTWHCPKCHRRYDRMSYYLACRHAALVNSTKLTATQLCALYEIKHATLRKWVEREHVAKRGKDQSGRVLYDVQQAIDMRNGERDEESLQSATASVTLEADHHALKAGGLSHSPTPTPRPTPSAESRASA